MGRWCSQRSPRSTRSSASLRRFGRQADHSRSCTRLKNVGTLKRTGTTGQDSVAFTGKLGRRALGVGRYRATIVVTDAAGNKSVPRSASFRIVPASR